MGGARKGANAIEMALEMPNICAINIFGDERNCRTDNKELLQPVHVVYDKEPRTVAIKQFSAFNIQLPYFAEVKEDYNNKFYCWCKLFYEMHFSKKSVEEVYAMETKMKDFVQNDAGAKQFVERYDEAVVNPAVRQAYHDWMIADFRERSILQGARLTVVLEIAKNMINRGRPLDEIVEDTGLTIEQVSSICN